MRHHGRVIAAVVYALSSRALAAASAGEGPAADVRWRLDVSIVHGVESGMTDRTEDAAVIGSVGRERRVLARGAVAATVIPLFTYEDPEPGRRFGAGMGVVARVYGDAGDLRGPFGEIGLAAIWVERRLIDDGSILDFQSHVAVGFAAANGAHFAVRLQHISNGRARHPNAGTNLIGVGVGFTF